MFKCLLTSFGGFFGRGESRAGIDESGVCHHISQLGLGLSCFGLDSIGFGGVSLGHLGESSLVCGQTLKLHERFHLGASILGVLSSGDDGASSYECSIGLHGGQLGGGSGCLCLEIGNFGGVVLGLCCELGLVGSKLDHFSELSHLLADAFIGNCLGLLGGGSVLASTLGNDGGGEHQREEDVGDLHIGGWRFFDGFWSFSYKDLNGIKDMK